MSEENILINPKDIEKEKREEEIKESIPKEKYMAKGNLVEVNLESKGRFSAPETVYFEDYSVADVQELAATKFDDIPETLVVILNRLKNKDTVISISEFTLAEFLECMIGIKVKFDTSSIKHPWICKCQAGVSQEEQKVNEDMINLSEVKFVSIEEADEKFKERFKEVFNEMSDEQFIQFLKERYENNPLENYETWTREKEIENVRIKEPIMYRSFKTGDVYAFEFMRVKHLLEAKKDVDAKYRPLLNSIHKKENKNKRSMTEFKAEKKYEMEKVEEQKIKEMITYMEALTLMSINGNPLKSNEEKYNNYKKLKRDEYFELSDFLRDIEYGVFYEKNLSCPLCGETERRLLHRELHPGELIPINADSESNERKRPRSNIYFGV